MTTDITTPTSTPTLNVAAAAAHLLAHPGLEGLIPEAWAKALASELVTGEDFVIVAVPLGRDIGPSGICRLPTKAQPYWAKRPGRSVASPFYAGPALRADHLVIIARRASEGEAGDFVLITAYPSPYSTPAPKEPGDPWLQPEERAASAAFWVGHAFVPAGCEEPGEAPAWWTPWGVLNLTQHAASPEQLAEGVRDAVPLEVRKDLLTVPAGDLLEETGYDSVYDVLYERARALVGLAREEWARLYGGPLAPVYEGPETWPRVMIGGLGALMAPLAACLRRAGFKPVYAVSDRVSVDLPDGKKASVFKHLGWSPGDLGVSW